MQFICYRCHVYSSEGLTTLKDIGTVGPDTDLKRGGELDKKIIVIRVLKLHFIMGYYIVVLVKSL